MLQKSPAHPATPQLPHLYKPNYPSSIKPQTEFEFTQLVTAPLIIPYILSHISDKSTKMATSNFFMLATMAFVLIAFPPKLTTALIPYNRPLWDMMAIPSEDPFKILEQTPLNLPKNLDTTIINLARADWKETAGHHVISLDVPGMKRGDIKIEVEESRVLRVSGERKAEEEEEGEGEKWHRAERTSGKFWRQFRLPGNADMEKITAQIEDGVLRIKVPKKVGEERRQSRVVEIVGGGSSSGEDIKATKAA
ncbi:hypothetical protein SSX86_004827 [Deinandra increscens subsp. villosa]|uniref:Uncharacterized protein n=1 Tax=Deinandra increscens subsp. villosa TaxID=3103831 RepID=A0AAP0DST0_9ASTR